MRRLAVMVFVGLMGCGDDAMRELPDAGAAADARPADAAPSVLTSGDRAAYSTCDALASIVFDQPQIGECLVEGAGFVVTGPAVPSENPALTWVADVQGRPNPRYPDLIQDGVVVRNSLGDCEWLACIAKR